MAGSLPPVTDYYRFAVNSQDPGGGLFTVKFGIFREGVFNGDGTEFGGGAVNGPRQLRRTLDKFCNGLDRTGWVNSTLGPVETNSIAVLNLNIPASD